MFGILAFVKLLGQLLSNFLMFILRNLSTEQLISIITKLKYLFYFLLYTVGEITDSYYPNLVHSIVKDTTIIDPFNMTNITGYVYFSISGAKYPTIYDEFLNLTVHGAIIKRKVEYCQYKQVINSFGIFSSGSFIDTYPTKWVPEYINSSNFVDKNFINPPLSVVVNETEHFNNVTIGNLTIPSFFYSDDLVFYYFEPSQEGIDNFTYSNASSSFEFINRGFFYHSVTNKSTLTRLEKIKKKLKEKGNEYDDILYETQKEMFQKCHSGDVRIRYRLYAPINVTYFGYVQNFTLTPILIDDIRFGATKRGANQSIRSLVRAYTPDGMYGEPDSLENFFSFSYLYIIKMKVAFDTWKFILRLFQNDPIRSTYWFLTVGFANLTFRSIIWSYSYLNLKLWASVLVGMLVLGLLCGIWKIQFRQTNNQVVDVHIHFDREALANMQQILADMRNAQIRVHINRPNPNAPSQNQNQNPDIQNQNPDVINQNINQNANNENHDVNNENQDQNQDLNQNVNN